MGSDPIESEINLACFIAYCKIAGTLIAPDQFI